MIFRYIFKKEGMLLCYKLDIDNINMETYFALYKEKQYGMKLKE